MQPNPILAAALAALASQLAQAVRVTDLVTAPRGADEVRLVDAPAPGSTRTTAHALELALDGGVLEVDMDGSPVPGMYLPDLDLVLADRVALTVVDAHDAEGWVRRYEEAAWTDAGELSMSSEEGEESFPWSADAESRLRGREVRFAGGAAIAFADGRDGDLELLAGLQADLGLGALLPDGPVAVGAAWTIDGADLPDLLAPGGDLAWDLPPEAAAELLPDVRSRALAGELELELEALADGVARCAVRGELVRTTVQAGDLTRVPVTDGTATDTVVETWEVDGALRWSVAEARLVELALSGALLHETHTVRDADQPGPSYESWFRVEGTAELLVTSELADR